MDLADPLSEDSRIDDWAFDESTDEGFESGVSTTWAQSLGWETEEYPMAVQETLDGGFIVAGRTISESIHSSTWVIRMDAYGGIVWQKIYVGERSNGAEDVVRAMDGGYVLAGWHMFDGTNEDGLVLKLDENGLVVWQHTYGGGGNDILRAAIENADGGFWVGGDFRPEGLDLTLPWILRLDQLGNVVWSKIYQAPLEGSVFKMHPSPDGGAVAVGSMVNGEAHDMLVFKIDPEGNLEWQKVMGERAGEDFARDITATPDGGYVVVGAASSYSGGGPWDAWMVKLDAAGNILWQRALALGLGDCFYSIHVTFDDGLVAAGYFMDLTADLLAALVVRMTADGSIMWQRIYGDYLAIDIRQTLDGGYIWTGPTVLFSNGQADFWVLKIDEVGTIDESCPAGMIEGLTGAFYETTAVARDAAMIPQDKDSAVLSGALAIEPTDAVPSVQCTR